MADVEPEAPADYSSRSRYRNRTERRARANRYVDGVETPSASTDTRPSNSTENNAVPGMDYLSPASTEREPVAPRKERKERRPKAKEETETKANDEDAVEGATAAEDTSDKKSLKKERSSDNSARKRKAKKNLREKRRSTGVVIMPNMDSEEDEDKTVKANTQQNEQFEQLANEETAADQEEETPKSRGSGNKRVEQKVQRESGVIEKQHLQEKIDTYESQVSDFKSQLDKANKELEQLRLDNQRLKDENSSLLRVVSQLSTMKSK